MMNPNRAMFIPFSQFGGKGWVKYVPAEEIAVADTLTNPHQLTVRLQRCLAQQKVDSYVRLSSNREGIDVAVAVESILRVLLIVDAFVKASEARV